MIDYGLYDIVEMKKAHPCHKGKYFQIVRMGVDIKIKCDGCGNILMLDRNDFNRKLKRVIKKYEEEK